MTAQEGRDERLSRVEVEGEKGELSDIDIQGWNPRRAVSCASNDGAHPSRMHLSVQTLMR